MAKRNVTEIETGAGFFMGFVNAMMDVVREKAIPFAAVYRLATAGGRKTLGSMIDLAYADWQAEQPKPVEQQPQDGHPYQGGAQTNGSPFSAPITYVQPEFEELKRRFPAYVNPDYKGKRFDPIERCKAVSKENRVVAFEYVHMDRAASTDEVLAEMDNRGLRPALYEELLGFAEKYPDEQRKYPIVALGSEADVHGNRHVAFLWNDDLGRRLGLGWIGLGWGVYYWFLAVPVGSAVERPLVDGEYRVPVSYSMPRDKATLESEFSKDGVSDLFTGNYEWQPHSSCSEIDQTPGERIMLVKYFGRDTTSEANIAEMDKLGYRPATHLEAYAFAKANPELQRQFWIVALGSSAMHGDDRRVAVLDSGSDGRILGSNWFDIGWSSEGRFLFVRK